MRFSRLLSRPRNPVVLVRVTITLEASASLKPQQGILSFALPLCLSDFLWATGRSETAGEHMIACPQSRSQTLTQITRMHANSCVAAGA